MGSYYCLLLFLFSAVAASPRQNPVTLVISCSGGNSGTVSDTSSISSGVRDSIEVVLAESCMEEVELQGVNIHMSSSSASRNHPLVVVARQGLREIVFSWSIPYFPESNNVSYQNVSRSLCPVNASSLEDTLYLDVYTTSPQAIPYEIAVELGADFQLLLGDSAVFEVGPSSPKIFFFEFPDNHKAAKVLLQAQNSSSSESTCFILSAQKKACPFNDLEENIRTEGLFQTVNTTALLEIKEEELKSSQIIIAIIAIKCPGATNSSLISSQTFNITILESPPVSDFISPIIAPVIIFFVGVVPVMILCTILYIFISCDYLVFCKFRLSIHKCGEWIKGGASTKESGKGVISREELAQDNRTVQEEMAEDNRLEEEADRCIQQYKEEFYVQECGSQICLPHRMYRNPHFMNVPPKEDYSDRVNRNFMFLWITIIYTIYYGLPAIQLLYTLILVSKETGEGDRCYFNYKCAHSVWIFTSFNNFWSNILYILFGALFLVIAVIKNVTYCVKRRKPVESHIGLPEYFGIYYGLGVLAITQGVMSAFYHICPTSFNIQYDTASMLAFGGLVIVFILYKRRILVRVNAGLAYLLFAVITFLVLLGLIIDNFPFRGRKVVLSIIFIILALNFTAVFYFLHDWNFLGGVKRINGSSWSFIKWIKGHRWKTFKLVVGTVLNLLVAIVFITTSLAFSTAVLGLFIVNDTFFIVFYLVAKIWYQEYLSVANTLTGILTLVFLVPAVYFFSHTEYETNDTPWLSREMNKDCSLANFYDIHDLWHFFSAIAMFFCYLNLLTLDDGVSHTKRSEIYAF